MAKGLGDVRPQQAQRTNLGQTVEILLVHSHAQRHRRQGFFSRNTGLDQCLHIGHSRRQGEGQFLTDRRACFVGDLARSEEQLGLRIGRGPVRRLGRCILEDVGKTGRRTARTGIGRDRIEVEGQLGTRGVFRHNGKSFARLYAIKTGIQCHRSQFQRDAFQRLGQLSHITDHWTRNQHRRRPVFQISQDSAVQIASIHALDNRPQVPATAFAIAGARCKHRSGCIGGAIEGTRRQLVRI